MAIKIRDAGGVLRTITGGSIRDGATLRALRSIKLMDGATLRTVATFVDPMTVSNPPDVYGFGSETTLTTQSVTVTPSGGSAPFTYAWVRDTGTATINSATSATTTFTETGMDAEETRSSTFTCTVTDATGQTATANVSAYHERFSSF